MFTIIVIFFLFSVMFAFSVIMTLIAEITVRVWLRVFMMHPGNHSDVLVETSLRISRGIFISLMCITGGMLCIRTYLVDITGLAEEFHDISWEPPGRALRDSRKDITTYFNTHHVYHNQHGVYSNTSWCHQGVLNQHLKRSYNTPPLSICVCFGIKHKRAQSWVVVRTYGDCSYWLLPLSMTLR